ncbi:MAG: cytochrome d ubiquinol oxidase subunit II [Denitrovibrio sp.]|nr:MAG: cytochrome d ubiquinol oxidase subunit II [Denitrovibrio sp.]
MIGNLNISILQILWWLIVSVVGSLFLFMTFVQGGQTLIWQTAKTEDEKSLVINSLGRKWELTFTTLVLFGGALFAAFPKFYATSFGGAYWVWIVILFTFIIQAVSYEYRKKPNNFLGNTTYELFLHINGFVGILLIGAAVGTFFTGSNFTLNDYNQVTCTHPLKGLEAAFSLFNLSVGAFLVCNARILGGMYLLNSIDFSESESLRARIKKSVTVSFVIELIFLLYVLGSLLFMKGFAVDEGGVVTLVAGKYLSNLLQPINIVLLLAGLLLVVWAVFITVFKNSSRGIWPAGLGTVLVGLAVFFLAGYNNTAFYPSKSDLQSSLTIFNASSSHFTLTAMTYVALTVPFVLAYIAYTWKQMNREKITLNEVLEEESY